MGDTATQLGSAGSADALAGARALASSAGQDAPDLDAAIVAGLRAGDDRAFELLVRTYVGPLRAVAMRLLQNQADADDAVQEALLSAFRGFANFRADARLGTWLHRIVVNAALQRLRRRRPTDEAQELEPLTELLPRFAASGYPEHFHEPWTSSIDELVTRAETRESVRAMIDRLPEGHRTVLILRDIEELDTQEAAELLGITPATLKVRLHRARQALRNLFERELELTVKP